MYTFNYLSTQDQNFTAHASLITLHVLLI